MSVNFFKMIQHIGKEYFYVFYFTELFCFCSDIADRLGVPYLQRSLSLQLTDHILKCLPELQRELQSRYRDLSKEVAEYQASAMFETSSTFDTKALVG